MPNDSECDHPEVVTDISNPSPHDSAALRAGFPRWIHDVNPKMDWWPSPGPHRIPCNYGIYIYLPRKLGHIKWAKCWDKNIPAPWVAYGLFEHLRTGYAMYAIPPKSCLKNFAISEMLRAQMPCSHLRIETHVLGRNRAHKKIWLPVGMKTKTERRLGSIITK